MALHSVRSEDIRIVRFLVLGNQIAELYSEILRSDNSMFLNGLLSKCSSLSPLSEVKSMLLSLTDGVLRLKALVYLNGGVS